MDYRVEWSPRAVEDLEAIAEYIAADSASYAAAVIKTILNTASSFSRFPFSGAVTVAAMVHGKRLLDRV